MRVRGGMNTLPRSTALSLCALFAWCGLCGACAPRPAFTGVDASTGQSLDLVPSRMPPGHSFAGAYSSPQSGKLYLVQRGEQLEGQYAYRICSCAVRGSLRGTAEGNLAQLEFREAFAECQGRRELAGRGYLFYQAVPLSTEPARLFGSRVYFVPGEDNTQDGRTAWTAVEVDPRTASAPDDGGHCP